MEYLGELNRKCGVCGKMIPAEPHTTIQVSGEQVEICSPWCHAYHDAH